METFEDDDISPDDCGLRADDARASPAPRSTAAALLLRLPPGLARPLALLLGLLAFTLAAGVEGGVRAGAAQLVRLRAAWVIGPGVVLLLVVAILSARLRRERWHGAPLDRWTLRAPLLVSLAGLALTPLWPTAVLVAWSGAAAALGQLPPWPWNRRIERAWLLHRPGYTRGLLVEVLLLGLAGPGLLGLGLRLAAPRLEARVDRLTDALARPDADCLTRLGVAFPGSVVDRLAVVMYGAGARGRPGEDLARCLAPELEERETLAQRLKFDSGELCRPEASGHNRDVFAEWAARRARLLGVRWLVAAFDPQARGDYGRALKAQADAAAACDDPLLVPQARLFDAADASGALGGCGARFAAASRDDWAREALSRMSALGQPSAFTGDAFPLAGRGWAARARERPSPAGVVRTQPIEAVLLRPRDGDAAFEVALHVRWLRAAQVGDALNPWMETRQRGNEVYLIECGGAQKAHERLDALRDAWGFADRRLMGSAACPRGFGRLPHHVLPFPGGAAFVVARYHDRGQGQVEVRLAYTETDPCPR